MTNNFNVFACANYILDSLQDRGINDLTNLKLEKLLYFAYGIHISLYNERLFDEPIQAWRLGPVVPAVYLEFKNYETKTIKHNSRARLTEDFTGAITTPKYTHLTDERHKCLSISVASLSNYKAWNIFDFKGKNSAWATVKIGESLNDDDIKKEFEAYHDDLAKILLDK